MCAVERVPVLIFGLVVEYLMSHFVKLDLYGCKLFASLLFLVFLCSFGHKENHELFFCHFMF